MSFSADVKEELARNNVKARHCQLAEIAGILCYLGKFEKTKNYVEIRVETENVFLAKTYYELVKRAFHKQPVISIKRNNYLNRNRVYVIKYRESVKKPFSLQALKLVGGDGSVKEIPEDFLVSDMLLQKSCCKRAYLRGVFMATGSITDPEKGYHFEVVCGSEKRAEQFIGQMAFFGIEAKTISRKGHLVVYIKEGAQIVDALNVMEAHKALMELENVRILKEVRNSVNRKVNCETANINKTVNAAVKQIEDIEYIKEHMGLDELNPNLYQVATLRLQYPEAPLKELGEMLNPPVGKSGVNHRLRKLSDIASDLRG
ncbi:MAG: DNA-binding protein WhiA [Lachnospiraceae bacterium]|nr:DNA-binding protein WhiA [Lachnospiraceae bacterium]